MTKQNIGPIGISVFGAVVSAAVSYAIKRALGVWGVLDDISDATGKYLKLHVPPAFAGWTIALIIMLGLYAVLLWRVWHVRHVHHVPIHALTPQQATVALEAVPTTEPQPSLFLELKQKHHLLERQIKTTELALGRVRDSYAEYQQHIEKLRGGYGAKGGDKSILDMKLAEIRGALDGVCLSGQLGDLIRFPNMIQSMGKDPLALHDRPMFLIEHNQPFIRTHMENRAAIEEQLRAANEDLLRMKVDLENLERRATEEAQK